MSSAEAMAQNLTGLELDQAAWSASPGCWALVGRPQRTISGRDVAAGFYKMGSLCQTHCISRPVALAWRGVGLGCWSHVELFPGLADCIWWHLVFFIRMSAQVVRVLEL